MGAEPSESSVLSCNPTTGVFRRCDVKGFKILDNLNRSKPSDVVQTFNEFRLNKRLANWYYRTRHGTPDIVSYSNGSACN